MAEALIRERARLGEDASPYPTTTTP